MTIFPLFLFLLLLTVSPTVDEAVADLGSPDWRVRQQASFVLKARMDKELSQRLQEEWVKTKDLEVEYRLHVLLTEYRVRTEPPERIPINNPFEDGCWPGFLPINLFKQFWPINQGN